MGKLSCAENQGVQKSNALDKKNTHPCHNHRQGNKFHPLHHKSSIQTPDKKWARKGGSRPLLAHMRRPEQPLAVLAKGFYT